MFLLFVKGILSGSMLVDWIIYKSINFPARKQGLCHLLGRHDFRRPCWWCRQHRCRPVVERKSAIFNCIPCKCLKSKHNLSVLKIKRKKTCPRNHEIIQSSKSPINLEIIKSSKSPNKQINLFSPFPSSHLQLDPNKSALLSSTMEGNPQILVGTCLRFPGRLNQLQTEKTDSYLGTIKCGVDVV